METIILKLGGSIFLPEHIDTSYLKNLKDLIESYSDRYRFVIIVGGGHTCRKYQNALKEVIEADNVTLDQLGIDVTKLNGKFFRRMFPGSRILKSLDEEMPESNIIIGTGYEPGHSTDFDALYLAGKFKNKKIIMLSNIKKIYTDDPRTNPDAKPLDSMSWHDLGELVGNEWVAGSNVPMDPHAIEEGKKQRVKVIFADGKNLKNLKNIFDGNDFEGTTIE